MSLWTILQEESRKEGYENSTKIAELLEPPLEEVESILKSE